MRRSLAWTAPLLTACAVLRPGGPLVDTEVAVRSHNASDVDVYLLCGDSDAEWLGVVPRQSGATFAIPPARRICPRGLNFFLVAPPEDHSVAQRAPQGIERIAESGPGVLLIALGPEERQEDVAAMKAARPGDREVGKEAQPLGLAQNGGQLIAAGIRKGKGAEQSQLDHTRVRPGGFR